MNNENTIDEETEIIDNHSRQRFIDWRLFLNNNNLSQFHLYILPVKV
jgi:hypothetical protein